MDELNISLFTICYSAADIQITPLVVSGLCNILTLLFQKQTIYSVVFCLFSVSNSQLLSHMNVYVFCDSPCSSWHMYVLFSERLLHFDNVVLTQ